MDTDPLGNGDMNSSSADIEAIRRELAQVRDDLSHLAATVKTAAWKRGAEVGEKTRQLVDENPVSSLLALFGVGMILGLALRRDRPPARYYGC